MTSRTNYYKTVSQVYKFKKTDADPNQFPYPDTNVGFPLTPLEQENINKSLNDDLEVIDYDNEDIKMNSNIWQRIVIPDEDTIPENTENFTLSKQIQQPPPAPVEQYFFTPFQPIENFVTEVPNTKETIVSEVANVKETFTDEICSCYKNKKATNNPVLWGPAFWYTLHNGAFHYPEHASPLHAERMKNFIIGIPVMVPCATCKEHATAFIEKHRKKLTSICASKETLFNFFVDFHNQVNKRYGKPVLSYEEAYDIYA